MAKKKSPIELPNDSPEAREVNKHVGRAYRHIGNCYTEIANRDHTKCKREFAKSLRCTADAVEASMSCDCPQICTLIATLEAQLATLRAAANACGCNCP